MAKTKATTKKKTAKLMATKKNAINKAKKTTTNKGLKAVKMSAAKKTAKKKLSAKKAIKKAVKAVGVKTKSKPMKKSAMGTVKRAVVGVPAMTPSNTAKSEVQNRVKIQMTNVQEMPDLTLPATGGQTVNLKALAGKKVILYFYPKDMTPGCTIEGHEFTKLKEAFASKNAVIFGVSRDSLEMHEKFKSKECYTIDLLSDEDEKLCNSFGVIKDKNMYGKIVRGIERSTFVFNENGQIIKEWRGVKAEGHAQEVLNYLSVES